MQPNSYLAITVYVYFDFLHPITTQIKRFLGFYNLKKTMFFGRHYTLSKKFCEEKNLRINLKIYVQQRRWICRKGLYLDLP